MKRIILLSVIILTSLAFRPGGTDCSVKYNGIYAIKLDEEHSAVLRFYADGTVLASTSVNDYMDVFSWFHKDNQDMVLKGSYKIKKCGIRFEVKGASGEQEYEGQINGDAIDIELKDEASKKTVRRTYRFFAL